MEASFWRDRWVTGQTGWDTGGPHRLLPDLLRDAEKAGLASGARILEPGCGRAHNGAELASRGFDVTSFDQAEEAIAAARSLYSGMPRLTLTTGNALAVREEWRGTFDAIFDRAMLCALAPEQRPAYVAACCHALKPGGLFLTLPFTVVHHTDGRAGPPFAVPMSALSDLLVPSFSLVSAREMPLPDPTDRIKSEMVAVWRRA